MKRKAGNLKSKKGNKIKNSRMQLVKENDIVQRVSELKSEEDHDANESKIAKAKKDLKRTSKTKFEEYLEMEMPNSDMLAQEDLELEKKLAKKLKVKGGKLRGDDDGLNILFEGFSDEEAVNHSLSKKRKKKKSVQQAIKDDIGDDSTNEASEGEEYSETTVEEIPVKAPSQKRRKKRKSLLQGQESDIVGETALSVTPHSECHNAEVASGEISTKALGMESSGKYVAPHLRSQTKNESEEQTRMRRRVRGLLNRLSESNVESITGEMATIFRVFKEISMRLPMQYPLLLHLEIKRYNVNYIILLFDSLLVAVLAPRLSVRRSWHLVTMVHVAMNKEETVEILIMEAKIVATQLWKAYL